MRSLEDIRNELVRVASLALDNEVDAERSSGEPRTNDDLALSIMLEILPEILDPRLLAELVDHTRHRWFCAYAQPDSCDCKFMPPRIAFLLDDPPPKLSSEQTGCPEIREAIRALQSGDWRGWQKSMIPSNG